MPDDALRQELLARAAEDLRVRDELARGGTLSDGYDPAMEAVHRENAAWLARVLDAKGWPGASRVGAEGAEAAWLIAQHAIGEPAFQRRCLALLRDASARGEAPAWQMAYLEDRIRVFEGSPQRYGTQADVDSDGEPFPFPIEDEAGVDDRRREVGLPPLAVQLARLERLPPPRDRARYQRDYEAWLRRVGWRE